MRSIAQEYPDVAYDEQLVDSMAALLVRDAARFDVVVTTNMYGDILSDEAAELSGGLGLAGSINAGDAHCMAQAQHGSAPDIAGKDLANPSLAPALRRMLLGWLGEQHGADRASVDAQAALDSAISQRCCASRRRAPAILAGRGTQAFGAALLERIAA